MGIKITFVRPESTLLKLGIERGDVVKRVNGIELHSPEDALTVYSRLTDARVIIVELERRGRPHHNVYLVR